MIRVLTYEEAMLITDKRVEIIVDTFWIEMDYDYQKVKIISWDAIKKAKFIIDEDNQ